MWTNRKLKTRAGDLQSPSAGLFPTRREFLRRASGGFGALALAGLCHETQAASTDPLAPRSGHFPAQADRVIFLYSTGGVSQVDTFDYKPQLIRDHGKAVTASRWGA